MKLSDCGRDVLDLLSRAPRDFSALKAGVTTPPGPLSRCVSGLIEREFVKVTKKGVYSITAAGKKALRS